MAATVGTAATVRLHLLRGENVYAKDEKGRTALLSAASRGHADVR